MLFTLYIYPNLFFLLKIINFLSLNIWCFFCVVNKILGLWDLLCCYVSAHIDFTQHPNFFWNWAFMKISVHEWSIYLNWCHFYLLWLIPSLLREKPLKGPSNRNMSNIYSHFLKHMISCSSKKINPQRIVAKSNIYNFYIKKNKTWRIWIERYLQNRGGI